MVGIRMPGEDQLPCGPRRDLVVALHELYSAAGKPALRVVSAGIRDRDDLPGTLSHQGVAAVLKGQGIVRWENLESLVCALIERQRVRKTDVQETVERIHSLWQRADDDSVFRGGAGMVYPTSGIGDSMTKTVAPESSWGKDDSFDLVGRPSSEFPRPEVRTATEHLSVEESRRVRNIAIGGTLEAVRAELMDQQMREHTNKLEIYRSILSDSTRSVLIAALRQAIADESISARGVRVRVWETDLYYRFVVSSTEDIIGVQLETVACETVSTHVWKPDEDAVEFYGQLAMAVRAAGADLGVLLNDPTESVQQLSEMLIKIAQLRSQAMLGYRYTVWKVVQKEDYGDSPWYFTETALIPGESLSYEITYDRLDEDDWEDHLRRKGWFGAGQALRAAKLLAAGNAIA
ncbi:hypothetical protein [Nocardia sp. NPDC055049]